MPLQARRTRHLASCDARRAAPTSIGRRCPIALVRGAVALLALAGAGSAQQTLHVDALGGAGAYTTIQSAIDAAATGDTILVAPGLYLETIDYLGKDLEVIADGAGGPATHVIDAQGDPFVPLWAPGQQFGGGPVVTFANGEGPGALLEGFTVTGGRGWSPGYSGKDTGGIRIFGASPTIRNCHVVGNVGGAGGHSSYAGDGGAGGLFVSGGAPRIVSCEIRDNVGGSYIMGSLQPINCGSYSGGPGGMLVFPDNPWINPADVQIVDCLFEGNAGAPGFNLVNCFLGQSNHGPGALWVLDGSVDIAGCVFSGNEGVQDANPLQYASSPGGVLVGRMDGLVSPPWFTAETRITESQFLGNTEGAVSLSAPESTLTLEGCVLWGNTGRTVSNRPGGQYNPSKFLSLVDCALIGNSGGPAVWSDGNEPVQFYASVIWGHDTAGAPIFYADSVGALGWAQAAFVAHSILYGNVGPLGNLNQSTAASCVEGGAPGSGNISADPLFVRAPSPGPDGSWGTDDDDLGDLHLASGSPCIDAGNNSIVPFGLHADAAGNVRFFEDPATVDTGVAGALGGPAVVDIGLYEHGSVLPAAEWTDLGQGLSATVWPYGPALAGSGALVGDAPTTLLLVDASPNAQAYLVLGLSQVDAPFEQGVLVPSPDVILPQPVDGTGTIALSVPWPLGLPSGLELFCQYWILDATGPAGFFASNGLRCVTP